MRAPLFRPPLAVLAALAAFLALHVSRVRQSGCAGATKIKKSKKKGRSKAALTEYRLGGSGDRKVPR